jgi:hypothetical protein
MGIKRPTPCGSKHDYIRWDAPLDSANSNPASNASRTEDHPAVRSSNSPVAAEFVSSATERVDPGRTLPGSGSTSGNVGSLRQRQLNSSTPAEFVNAS